MPRICRKIITKVIMFINYQLPKYHYPTIDYMIFPLFLKMTRSVLLPCEVTTPIFSIRKPFQYQGGLLHPWVFYIKLLMRMTLR